MVFVYWDNSNIYHEAQRLAERAGRHARSTEEALDPRPRFPRRAGRGPVRVAGWTVINSARKRCSGLSRSCRKAATCRCRHQAQQTNCSSCNSTDPFRVSFRRSLPPLIVVRERRPRRFQTTSARTRVFGRTPRPSPSTKDASASRNLSTCSYLSGTHPNILCKSSRRTSHTMLRGRLLVWSPRSSRESV